MRNSSPSFGRISTLSVLFIISAITLSTPSAWALPGRSAIPGDFSGDRREDFATYDPSSAQFLITAAGDYGEPVLYGTGRAGDLPASGDFNADGKWDATGFDPSTAVWTVANSVSFSLGQRGDVPVPGYYLDQTCNSDLGQFNNSQCCGPWNNYCSNSLQYIATNPATYDRRNGLWTIGSAPNSGSSSSRQVVLGGPGNVPVPADFNCDGRTDPAVFDRRTNTWSIRPIAGAGATNFSFGLPGDVPFTGDFDGDRCADAAVYRPTNNYFYIRTREGNARTVQLGLPGDRPLMIDYDADRKTDFGVFRPSNGTYFVLDALGRFSSLDGSSYWVGEAEIPADFDDFIVSPGGLPPEFFSGIEQYQNAGNFNFGVDGRGMPTEISANNIPLPAATQRFIQTRVPGDWARMGKSAFVVVEPVDYEELKLNYWAVVYGLETEAAYFFGLPGDVPVPADYDGDGRIEPAVIRKRADRQIEWRVRERNGTESITPYGLVGDQPISGDYDCDGRYDKAVVRTIGGGLQWFINLSGGGQITSRQFGLAGDRIFATDMNADGCDDLVVGRYYLGGVHWFHQSVQGGPVQSEAWGLDGDDMLTPMDFDGDSLADLIVARNVGGAKHIFIKLASGGYQAINFGLAGDSIMAGHYSGVNRAELAAYRIGNEDMPSTFFVRRWDGSTYSQMLGAYDSIVIRPDGSAIDRFAVSEEQKAAIAAMLGCSESLSKTDGARTGRLWKPYSDSNGKAVMLLSKSYGKQVKSLQIYNAQGALIETMKFDKIANGARPHFRGKKTSDQLVALGGKPITVKWLYQGRTQCVEFPDPRLRWD